MQKQGKKIEADEERADETPKRKSKQSRHRGTRQSRDRYRPLDVGSLARLPIFWSIGLHGATDT